MTANAAEGWAEVSSPGWLWGGSPSGLFRSAQLLTRAGREGSTLVRTQESYDHAAPDLLRFIRAAGPTSRSGGLARLADMSDDAIDQDVVSGHEDPLRQEMGRLSERGGGLHDFASFHQLASMSAPMASFADQAQATMEQLLEYKVHEDQTQVFPDAGVYAIQRDDALVHRIKIISVLLRIEHDPRLAAGDLSGILLEHEHETRGAFASAAGLHSGYYMLDAYIGPLLGALTPGVWGFAAHRGRGPIVYSFGRAVAGGSATAPELLRTIQTPGADRVIEFVDLRGAATPIDPTSQASPAKSRFDPLNASSTPGPDASVADESDAPEESPQAEIRMGSHRCKCCESNASECSHALFLPCMAQARAERAGECDPRRIDEVAGTLGAGTIAEQRSSPTLWNRRRTTTE